MAVLAPAKLNLFLQVIGRRDDGYHRLQSLVFFSTIGDHLDLQPAARDELALTGPFAADLSNDWEINLVGRAINGLRQLVPDLPPLKVTLEKHLPVASGIGGGSTDAATALRMALSHCPIMPDDASLARLLASLGADCPVCYEQQTTLMQGIGERLSPWPAMPDYGVLLVNPRQPVSTAAIFKKLGVFTPERYFTAPADSSGWLELMQATHNDLQPVAVDLVPAIGEMLQTIGKLSDCLLARMSGSGATCYGLFLSPEAARRAAEEYRTIRPGDWIEAGGIWHGPKTQETLSEQGQPLPAADHDRRKPATAP